MLSFTGNLRVFLALEPCDMRKSFSGLHAAVSERLGEDPMQGAVFALTNRRRSLLKLLYWDGHGFWVMAKRLETGAFSWPKTADPSKRKLKLAPEALALLMNGVDMKDGCMRPWYERG